MKNKIKYFAIAFGILITNLVFISNVFGDSIFKVSLTGNDDVKKGNEITLSLTIDPSGIQSGFSGYQGILTYDKSKLEYVSMTSSVSKWDVTPTLLAESISILGSQGSDLSAPLLHSKMEVAKIKFKVLSSASTGATTVEIKDLYGSDGDDNSLTASPASKTFTIEEKSEPPVTPTKSNDATLKNLTATGYSLSPAFSANNTSYSVTVPNDVKNIDLTAITNNSKATVKVNGNKSLSVGKNTVMVEVTAEDGTKKVYTVEVTRKSASNGGGNSTPTPTPTPTPSPKPSSSSSSSPSPSPTKSSNNRLKSISGVTGLNFDPNVTEYSIELPNEITNLDVSAIAENSKAKVTITNGKINNLKVGVVNTVVITVKAEDGSVKVYTVNVKRGATTSETDLEKLIVNDNDLLLEDDGTGIYNVTIPANMDKLNINAIPKSEGSTVRIKGNNNLKNGNNVVVVEVTDKNGFSRSYTINVKKKNSLFDFIDKYWFILLLIPLIIMIYLIRKYFKNEELIRELDENQDDIDEKKALDEGRRIRNNIDNDKDIYYNSNDRISTLDKTDMDELMNDDSITDFEVKIARNGKNDSKNIYKRR